ncbi:MAG: endonuclease NucS [Candidatus Odinarchaeum yellowstonii]|uniref:Endonuclease NucS n=1 Tax=Odinarchaeota yellowstonii (strain LCB_4) TaxID=1841599 RepID=A0AAF0IBR6_ODILC|nr:MAG: endonuclease NucS [Candidatus Odinarchaeum yellowstonii]
MKVNFPSSNNGKVEIINKTNLEDYHPYIEEFLARNHTLIIIGEFKVEYTGRASSNIGLGERFLIIKKDKSFLIHRERGASPLNWQPPGNLIHVAVKNNKLFLKAIRRRPREILLVEFNKIFSLISLNTTDKAEFIMDATEEQMQEAVLRKPEILFKGFKPVSSEKHIKPGFIDVYGFDSEGNPVIVELKRTAATRESVIQLKKYLDSYSSPTDGMSIRGILAAPSITKSAEILLNKLGLEFKKLNPRECAEIVKHSKASKLTEFI